MDKNNNRDCLILNFWACQNYGAILTCYGLYCMMIDLGINSKVIKFFPNNTFEKDYNNSFTEQFARKYMVLTKQVKSNSDFIELNNVANIFIAGSDQIWNPKIVRSHHENVSDGVYQLDFVNNKNKKISYSTSFGTDFFNGTDEEKLKFKQRIKSFDAISIREDSGVKLLKEEFDAESEQLIDGAFLIPKDKLDKLITQQKDNEKYIGCFSLPYFRNLDWYKKHLDTISRLFNLPIKTLPFNKNTPVEEWLSFIKNSELIISDSYHAIVFSIIFNKPFIQLQNALTQNRFDSLYRLLEINANVLDETTPLIENHILKDNNNWNKVNKKINNEVKKAKEWILAKIK